LALHWRQFEKLISEVFRHKYKRARIEITSPSVDGGADIVMSIGGVTGTEIVQCKRYRLGGKVSSPEMQRFVGAMTKFKAKKGYFVTTGEFSRQAIKFAEGLNVELIDAQTLIHMISKIEDFPTPAEFSRRPTA